jgi:hypothetical protein
MGSHQHMLIIKRVYISDDMTYFGKHYHQQG